MENQIGTVSKSKSGLSAFSLKLIAMILMLGDHVVEVLGSHGWGILPNWTYFIRYIARLSFPIFAYFIVVGWEKTSDKARYIFRLFLCAFFSQIPFSLAFYPTNLFVDSSSSQGIRCRYSIAIAVIGIIFTLAYGYFFLYKKKPYKYAIGVLAACLLPTIYLFDINGIRIIGDSLNVLYTLGLGAVVLFEIDNIKERALKWWEHLILILAIVLAVLAFGISADYGNWLMGIILIVALYLGRIHRWIQSTIIIVWGFIFYGILIGNIYSALGTVLAAVLIITYNQQSGPKNKFTKYLFYVFYPAHLLIIGLVNVFIKLL